MDQEEDTTLSDLRRDFQNFVKTAVQLYVDDKYEEISTQWKTIPKPSIYIEEIKRVCATLLADYIRIVGEHKQGDRLNSKFRTEK